MPAPDSQDDYDVPPRLLAIARALGIREVTARWKIIRWRKRWRRLVADLTPAPRRSFDRQICQSCGALQSKGAKICDACGKSTGTRVGGFLRAVGLSVPRAISVSSALGLAMIIIYARMMLARPGQGLVSWDTATLIEFGGDAPSAVHAGQWWRLGTAMFLHIGLWHIGFNLLALAQVGPVIENIFGRGRMLFFFILTGVVGFAASEAFGHYPVSAGASGALMGLIGLAAGWGHRVGTTRGRTVRNQMLKWAAYTMLFGFAIHANNWAHGGGFLSGALIGYAYRPRDLEMERKGTSNVVLGLVGMGVTLVLVYLCLSPPAAQVAGAAPFVVAPRYDDEEDVSARDHAREQLRMACVALDAGKPADAVKIFRGELNLDSMNDEQLVPRGSTRCARRRLKHRPSHL